MSQIRNDSYHVSPFKELNSTVNAIRNDLYRLEELQDLLARQARAWAENLGDQTLYNPVHDLHLKVQGQPRELADLGSVKWACRYLHAPSAAIIRQKVGLDVA